MGTIFRFIFSLLILFEAYLIVHVDSSDRSSLFNVRPIEIVTVVSSDNGWTSRLNVFEKVLEHGMFVTGVDDGKRAFEFRLWGVVKVIYICRYDFTIGDEETLNY